jgi:hypothetical protein
MPRFPVLWALKPSAAKDRTIAAENKRGSFQTSGEERFDAKFGGLPGLKLHKNQAQPHMATLTVETRIPPQNIKIRRARPGRSSLPLR